MSQYTKFKKTIAVTPENHDWIVANKKKKSIAGKLDEIINCYIKNYGKEKTNKHL